MKLLLIFTAVLCFLNSFSQEQLYYFTNSDSTGVGVRTASGSIIVPLQFSTIGAYDFDHPITTPFIEMYCSAQDTSINPMNPNQPSGRVYDRTGKFLYTPFLYDNGPDYWHEGIRRYVQQGKVGYVDLNNNRLTDPKVGFADFFNYGYASFYEGAVNKVYNKGGEHWTVSPANDSGRTYLINRDGVEVQGSKKPSSAKDYYYEGLYYPYPFHNTTQERALIERLNQSAEIHQIDSYLFSNHEKADEPDHIQFEIVTKPSVYMPYYTIQGYKRQRADDNWVLEATADGQYFYFQNKVRIPLDQWIRKQLVQANKSR